MPEYFPHDYGARNDIKLKKLIMEHGVAGIGIFWCIVEMLYEDGGMLPDESVPVISFDLRTDEHLVNSVIDDFGLFVREGNFFSSPSVARRLEERANKSEKAKQSITARWNKYERNTNVIRTYDERITGSNTLCEQSKYDENENVILKRKEKKRK